MLLDHFKKISFLKSKLFIFSVVITVIASIAVFFTNCSNDGGPIDLASIPPEALIPNLSTEIQSLASQYPDQLKTACSSWDFIDLVVTELKSHNERFGYSCESTDCNFISQSQVAFYFGSGTINDAHQSIQAYAIDIVNCKMGPQTTWTIQASLANRWLSQRTDGTYQSDSCNVPNGSAILAEIATSHPEAFEDMECGDVNGTGEFLDRTITALRTNDQRFGYHCISGDCTQLSKNTVAYYCGLASPTSNSIKVNVLKIVDDSYEDCPLAWSDQTQAIYQAGSVSRWRYPPPNGLITSFTPTMTPTVTPSPSSSPTPSPTPSFTPSPTPSVFVPPLCDAPNNLSLLKQKATQHAQALQNSIHCQPQGGGSWEFLEEVLKAFRQTDTKWGYYYDKQDQANIDGWSPDHIAYYCGNGNGDGSNNVRVIDIFPYGTVCQSVQWVVDTEGTKAFGSGLWKYPGPGSKTCTPEKLLNSPQQGLFIDETGGITHITLGINEEQCSSQGYNILAITQSFVDTNTCCRRSSKTVCPTGYQQKTVNGQTNCFPDCGTAALFAGYKDTSKVVLTGKKKYPVDQRNFLRGGDKEEYISTCDGLNKIEQDNCGQDNVKGLNCLTGWKDFTFYDPYRFKKDTGNSDIAEVVDPTSTPMMCCVREEPAGTPAQPHNADGTYTGSSP